MRCPVVAGRPVRVRARFLTVTCTKRSLACCYTTHIPIFGASRLFEKKLERRYLTFLSSFPETLLS